MPCRKLGLWPLIWALYCQFTQPLWNANYFFVLPTCHLANCLFPNLLIPTKSSLTQGWWKALVVNSSKISILFHCSYAWKKTSCLLIFLLKPFTHFPFLLFSRGTKKWTCRNCDAISKKQSHFVDMNDSALSIFHSTRRPKDPMVWSRIKPAPKPPNEREKSHRRVEIGDILETLDDWFVLAVLNILNLVVKSNRFGEFFCHIFQEKGHFFLHLLHSIVWLADLIHLKKKRFLFAPK